MSKTYVCKIEVRGYELDSYGHVNHAEYIRYLEHARWKLLEEEGVTLKRLGEWKRWPVLGTLEVKYLKPAFIGEHLEVRSRVVGHRRVGFEVEQMIFRGEEKILQARIGAVIVNELGRPDEIPPEMKKMWEAS